MNAADIESALEDHYIGLRLSRSVKVALQGGDIVYGKFKESNQTKENSAQNKWMFSCFGLEILLDGEEILSISKYQ